ncbi:LysR family transcriptional regulator [uncultured Ferrovibrio sp.]|jgi:Transcriptional regulator|uniref:LysR family transcriptional regulator n=1 Tax=uncultured Ferrovibrio sp. TaxID=1576913 RepID=UPI00262EF87D|nr:LysR family transcriptional regulator [uncultured Ferrovibrio sp.]
MLNEIDLSRTDLNLLVLFDVVLQERHVGHAAARLNLTPSAISHGLGRLRRLMQDPLFLKTPKGVVPTQRALELAAPVAEILARVKSVIATAEPFDPAASTRRFSIAAPDAIIAVFLTPLLAALRSQAPQIDVSIRQLLPAQAGLPVRAWEPSLDDLEARSVDIIVGPLDEIPPRFARQVLFDEDFVIAARRNHPFLRKPSLRRYCEMEHLVVSQTGDAQGFVDLALTKRGLKRRVALTVPNFMMALSLIAESDLIGAVPRRFVAAHGARFGVTGIDVPLPLPRSRIRAITPKVALMDAGLAWLFSLLREVVPGEALGRGRGHR